MRLRDGSSFVGLAFVGVLLLATISAPAGAAAATATPKAAAATSAGPPTDTPTPAPTRTPAPTPTATATLTELQNRLLLADTYLKAGQSATAAELYTAILAQERGQPEALAGLKKALEGQTALTATAAAPRPTTAPATPAPPSRPGFGSTLLTKTGDAVATVLPFLLIVLALYVLSQALRWIMFAVREFYYLKLFPFFRQPAQARPFLMGEIADGTGMQGFPGTRVVTQRITEKLLAWNQLIQAREIAVEPAPPVELGSMAWIKVLWTWLVPPPRAYKIDGALMGNQPGAYRLMIRRTDLSTNRVDASRTFETTVGVPEVAFQGMAELAAKWLCYPRDIEASVTVARGMRAAEAGGAAAALASASEIYDAALDLLLPVRQQINQDAVDYADARERLRQANELLQNLPDGSRLYADLKAVIADLSRSVPNA
ncbi:MAG: hypothetical protein MUC51_00565 [Anaerolineae bacterium]|jgi:hypothetical protein|nr:hypothetical protein [Anaerolineae bacterium]